MAMASLRIKRTLLAVCLVAVVSSSSVAAAALVADGMHASVTKVFVECTRETFTCASDQKCLPNTFVCDGIGHCADRSDETGCSKDECDLMEFFQCKLSPHFSMD